MDRISLHGHRDFITPAARIHAYLGSPRAWSFALPSREVHNAREALLDQNSFRATRGAEPRRYRPLTRTTLWLDPRLRCSTLPSLSIPRDLSEYRAGPKLAGAEVHANVPPGAFRRRARR